MKIYLCPQKPEQKTHTWYTNIAIFNSSVENSEATSIVCDHFLSLFTYNELPEALKMIASKMRLGAELIIVQPDINLLFQRFTREEINEEALNNMLFKAGPVKGAFSTERIEALIPPSLKVEHKHFDTGMSTIIIKARRGQ
tara:strand:+ start:293 stop:715 length:423 start_codon:yes stop_codon:yes gene_type:complete